MVVVAAAVSIEAAVDEVVVADDGKVQLSFSFEISVAEIICRKDTAKILEMTIKSELTVGLETLSKRKLHVFINREGIVDCTLGDVPEGTFAVSLSPQLYVTGDLAFYGMVLGKEGMSGKHCHLCQTSLAEMKTLARDGQRWTYEEMDRLAASYQSDKRKSKKATMGMKNSPWFKCIPLENYVVPLLHCLIGVGNDLFSKFRDIVSEEIEYISQEEILTREAQAAMASKIDSLVATRDSFQASIEGRRLESLRGKLKRAKTTLEQLRSIGQQQIPDRNFHSPTSSPFAGVLDGITDFIENNEPQSEIDILDEPPQTIGAESPPHPEVHGPVERKIQEVKIVIEEISAEMKPLDQKLINMRTVIRRGRAHLKVLKDKIKEQKSLRKRKGDGIESQLFAVMRRRYGVKIQAYHGGSLHGKDTQKMMTNSGEMFAIFSTLLKANKKKDSTLSDTQVDELCDTFRTVFVLWDGAFSFASKTDPTTEDIEMFSRFVTAAVTSHIRIGCSATPKLHLMWKHVKEQMSKFPGGLGQKREDWMEKLHQLTSVKRKQFSTAQNKEQRANAMANSIQQESDPAVVAFHQEAIASVRRGPRKGTVKVGEERRKIRMEVRFEILQRWESQSKHSTLTWSWAEGPNSGDASDSEAAVC